MPSSSRRKQRGESRHGCAQCSLVTVMLLSVTALFLVNMLRWMPPQAGCEAEKKLRKQIADLQAELASISRVQHPKEARRAKSSTAHTTAGSRAAHDASIITATKTQQPNNGIRAVAASETGTGTGAGATAV